MRTLSALFPAPKERVTLLAAIKEILGHDVDVISLHGLLWSAFRSYTRSALAKQTTMSSFHGAALVTGLCEGCLHEESNVRGAAAQAIYDFPDANSANYYSRASVAAR
jgi:hypothetical protein